ECAYGRVVHPAGAGESASAKTNFGKPDRQRKSGQPVRFGAPTLTDNVGGYRRIGKSQIRYADSPKGASLIFGVDDHHIIVQMEIVRRVQPILHRRQLGYSPDRRVPSRKSAWEVRASAPL